MPFLLLSLHWHFGCAPASFFTIRHKTWFNTLPSLRWPEQKHCLSSCTPIFTAPNQLCLFARASCISMGICLLHLTSSQCHNPCPHLRLMNSPALHVTPSVSSQWHLRGCRPFSYFTLASLTKSCPSESPQISQTLSGTCQWNISVFNKSIY